MDTEIELKFLVSEQVISQLPALITQFSKKVSNKASRNLQNAYFDTPSRELRSLDIGLRTRSADGQCEQTIKLAGKVVGGLHQRPEYNIPISGTRPDITLFDSAIWPAGLEPSSINANLFSIFSTHFIRRTWLIETDSGTEIELVLDKGDISASGKSVPICEVEMELISGERAELFALATKLINCSDVRLGLYSKAARGYRLADNQPLTPDTALQYVLLKSDYTQEQAFEKCLQYGIEFVQKHEQCYIDAPKLKTLKRVADGVMLIRHSFWLFEQIADKQITRPLRKELKWLLETFAWVENAIQLKTFTSKKHAFYKKVSSAPELENVINELKSQQPSEQDILAVFHSPRYNQLILDLTLWLVEKRWRSEWQQSHITAASIPVTNIAAQLFEKDWSEMQNLLPQDVVSATNYIEKRQKLQRNLLSGCCLGELFPRVLREDFRAPWLDIIHGMDELATYHYLKQLCESQKEPEHFNKILVWLEQKTQGLLAAMEHCRLASQKLEPYWQ